MFHYSFRGVSVAFQCVLGGIIGVTGSSSVVFGELRRVLTRGMSEFQGVSEDFQWVSEA